MGSIETTKYSRIRVFLDFWNFQLALNEHTNSLLQLDWIKLPVWIANRPDEVLREAGGPEGRYMGGCVYASYDPWRPDDKKLVNWLNSIVARAPGIVLMIKERKLKSAPKCPICHKEIELCPHCGAEIRRTGEKGIDTGLVTDLIMGAWEDIYDTAVLVSSDADFIPAVRFIQTKGKRVINACFPPSSAELQRECWSSVNLIALLDQIPQRS
ncbi:NYN domain-containing protein [Candidatus Bipolaricaulota bacterium]|nr:NYN domain-containing protein [Candidatus Bipolaricaulota bacterium]